MSFSKPVLPDTFPTCPVGDGIPDGDNHLEGCAAQVLNGDNSVNDCAAQGPAAPPESNYLNGKNCDSAQNTSSDSKNEDSSSQKVNKNNKPAGTKTCVVCNKMDGKYKCPRCHSPFPPTPAPKSNKCLKMSDDDCGTASVKTAEHTSPLEVIAQKHGDEISNFVAKHPGLEEVLQDILMATMPPGERGLQSLQSRFPTLFKTNNPNATWDREMGIQNGVEALRRARKHPEIGHAVDEFFELITYLLDKEGLLGPAAASKLADSNAPSGWLE
ncbi:uncharacterized protein CTHT_0002150 [Thermochaetoides thermophila DSM 1495]|uniref:HIT-type domain-containing protein n=1 Tax=Chaetomium thermophilum (strain DSM 1495 / CBS 144.50 / IMI 039719) TaxID=759272 RepID=G0RZ93_CHATD|nr:hypothetical protein CTHT_0002150 [Thermochaetoides thermophila DSM 1495]EGS23521.1 hypothetical protein CTHT_0002150 [Thermochaetoides thermophila DSM 1495]